MIEIAIDNTAYYMPENWNEVTLGMVSKLPANEDNSTLYNMMAICALSGIPPELMKAQNIDMYNLLLPMLDFTKEEIPKVERVKEYYSDGKKFKLVSEYGDMCLAQVINIENLVKQKEPLSPKFLSMLYVEDGMQFSEEAAKDNLIHFETMPYPFAIGVQDFFFRKEQLFMQLMSLSSRLIEMEAILQKRNKKQ